MGQTVESSVPRTMSWLDHAASAPVRSSFEEITPPYNNLSPPQRFRQCGSRAFRLGLDDFQAKLFWEADAGEHLDRGRNLRHEFGL